MALMRTGDFGEDDVLRIPVTGLLDDVSAGVSSLGKWTVRNHRLIFVLIAIALGICAVWLFTYDQFQFSDVFRSRLLLAATPIPLIPVVLSVSGALFDLRFFQINPKSPRQPSRWRRFIAYFGVTVLVGGLLAVILYFLDPIGAYASTRWKAVINVFYVTDRQKEGSSNGIVQYGGVPNDQSGPESQIQYGTGAVAVPWTRWDVVQNLDSQVPLSREQTSFLLHDITKEEFLNSVKRDSEGAKLRAVLIFIHGFANSFTDGIQSSARLGFDLKFDGPIICYSWPSKGQVDAYSYDGEKSNWSTEHLSELLSDLVDESHVQGINVIAHSMGNRVLAGAVALWKPGRSVFTNLIMAAPDIDDSNFNQDREFLTASTTRVTVYVSTWDTALGISHKVNQSPRVGEEVICRPQIDVVDTQGLQARPWSFYHGYVFESDLILSDMGTLIQHSDVPADRIHIQPNDDHCTWRLQPR
jgi:esterase/lipase superfamily enzyme